MTPTRRPVGWSGAVGEYVTAMHAANRSPGTIRLHRHYLNQVTDVCPSPWRVTEHQLLELMARETWGPEAKKSARAVFRGFFRWAHGHGFIEDDPAQAIGSVHVPVKMARPAPEIIVRDAVASLDSRLRLMAQLAAFGGLRAREIAAVHSDDVFGDVLVVHGKGGKERLVPLLEPQLHASLQLVHGYAFPNRWTGRPITPGHVTKLMSEALPGRWTAHTFRHRLATQAYDGTTDLLAVMTLLGHSRPETTLRYVRLGDERLRAASRAAVRVAA